MGQFTSAAFSRTQETHQAVKDATGMIPHRHNFAANREEVFTVDGWKPDTVVNYASPVRIDAHVITLPVPAPIKKDGKMTRPPQPDNSAALKEVAALKDKYTKASATPGTTSKGKEPTSAPPLKDERSAVKKAEEAAEVHNKGAIAQLKTETGATSDADLEVKLYGRLPGLRQFMAWWNNRGAEQEAPASDASPKGPVDDGPGGQ